MEKHIKAYKDAKKILAILGDGDHKLHRKVAEIITVNQLENIMELVNYYEGKLIKEA